MKRLRFKEVLEKLYSNNNLSEWEDYEKPLYYFLEESFGYYNDLVNNMDEGEFCVDSNKIYFKGAFTKRRLLNMIHKLEQEYMGILQSCYKGDIYYATQKLYNLLLCKNAKISQYLEEPYINYFDYDIITDKVFYRMRDEKIEKDVHDCSHVPFNLRHKIECK